MKFLPICALSVSLLFTSNTAFAHKFIMSAWVEGDRVFLEAAFSDGSSAKHARIEVFDNSSGDKLLEGETDESGEFSFKIPKKATLRVHGNAGMGHQGEEILAFEDIAEGFVEEDGAPAAAEIKPEAAQAANAPAPAVTGISKAELKKVVEAAVELKLRPIVRKLATEGKSEGPSMQDILGGIGYIIGLVGLGTYFNYRRKGQER
jgi:nickel transport protein